MFLITTVLQGTRSKRYPDRPGRVYLRIAGRSVATDGGLVKECRTVSTNIMLASGEAIDDVINRLRPFVMMLYLIIEGRIENGDEISLDDVVADFRRCIDGEMSMRKIIDEAQAGFTIRTDIVRLGNDLKRHFKLVCPIKQDSANFLNYIEIKARQCVENGQDSTGRSYMSLKNSLSKFVSANVLPFSQINKDFVSHYSDWLEDSGVRASTQSFYLRNLRTIVNSASDEGLINVPANFFQGLNTRVIFKRDIEEQVILTKEALKKIADVDLSDDKEAELVRDMFMFGFYCRGMELMEIMTLKKSYIKNGILKYRRRMKGNERVVPLDNAAYDILQRYITSNRNYIFPLLEKYIGLPHHAIVQKVYATIKRVGKNVGFPALTFTMNISCWHNLMSQIKASEILFGT